MCYCDFVTGITFRIVKPHTPLLPLGFDWRTQRWLKFPVLFEIFNTQLPVDEDNMKQRLREFCFMPKMSTFSIAAMINRAVHQMSPDHVFINVGVWHGFTLLAGMADNLDKACIGVDNFSSYGSPREDFREKFDYHRSAKHQFYEMDYVDYFSNVHKQPIGVYIYDGDHSYANQLRGLQIAEPYFSDNCIILIDDANYDATRRGTRDFIAGSSNQYEVIFDETTYGNSHPTFWNGFLILQRVSQKSNGGGVGENGRQNGR